MKLQPFLMMLDAQTAHPILPVGINQKIDYGFGCFGCKDSRYICRKTQNQNHND